MKNNLILVSGSLAYDRIMDFPGSFKNHILPNKIHILNVCFVIGRLNESFGGTAGNIAYNLALLGERAKILGTAGNDFAKYDKWLRKNKADVSEIRKYKEELTAGAYIITDKNNNQITGFYPGSADLKYCEVAKKYKNAKIAIVAPDIKERMLEYVKIYKRLKVPYIFDPGQQITEFAADELKTAVKGAKVLIGNDYEIELIADNLKLSLNKLKELVEIIIITKGAKGSEICADGGKITIPPAKAKKILDPTGAGDAYRAGLIKGLASGLPLAKTGRLAGTVAVYAVENYGTQNHRFSFESVKARYYRDFGEKI